MKLYSIFDVCYSPGQYPKFGLTVNKIVISPPVGLSEDLYFYIDYRDCNYGGSQNDITIRIVHGSGVYYAPDLHPESSLDSFSPISNGDTLKFWEV